MTWSSGLASTKGSGISNDAQSLSTSRKLLSSMILSSRAACVKD